MKEPVMKKQPEIMETQFKKAADQIRLQPSERAWQRLEQKLDQKLPAKRRFLQAWVWTAAAALLLALSVLWWHHPAGNGIEQLVHSQPPASLEELEATGSCEPYCLMIKHRNELPMDYRFPSVNAVQ
ncbi:MAG: hypothetical protein Kow0027_03750 [Saprospiraceae bacterium]|jgi:hypothetical protein|nr:hypothetical protein [Saprospirales bacterium]